MPKFLVVFFFLAFSLAKSQTLQGTVTNYEGKPVAMANVLVKNASEPEVIVEFGFTKKDGTFSITLQKEYTELLVEVTALGYQNEVMPVADYQKQGKTILLDFSLRKDDTELKTVVVKSYKIKERNDTVFYNPKAFMDGSERKVEDMLKKLPGVEVDKNGMIKYQGKSVEAVMLDGDNIFDKNYQVGTRNINVGMVTQVQGIDKFSENPLLKGIEHSEKVALNLVLKKGETDYSGSASAHYGITDRYLADATVLAISQAQKSFAVVNYNNIGINTTPYDYFGGSSYQDILESSSMASSLISDGVYPTVLGEERSRINDTWYASLNNFLKLPKKATFRTNISYLSDDIFAESTNENEYSFNQENIYTYNQETIHKKPSLYRADFQWKKPIQELSSLEYNGRISYEDIQTESEQVTNFDSGFSNQITTEHLFIKNHFLYTQKLNSEQAMQASLVYNRSDKPQLLSFNRSNEYLQPNTNFTTQKSHFTKHQADANVLFLGKNSLGNYEAKVGIRWNSIPYFTVLTEQDDAASYQHEDFINHTQYNIANTYAEGTYFLKIKKFTLTPKLVLNSQVQHLTNETNGMSSQQSWFAPALSVQYKLGKSVFSAQYNFQKNTLQEQHIFANKMLANSRFLLYNNPSLEYINNQNASFNYSYNDTYNQFRMNASVQYNDTDQSFMPATEINDVYNSTFYALYPLGNSSFSVQMGFEKYIPFLESTVKLRGNYTESMYFNFVNSSEVRDNVSKLYVGYLFLKTAFDIPVNFQHELNVLSNDFVSQNTFVNSNTNLNYKGTVFYKVKTKMFASFTAEYFLPNTDKKSNEYWFLDATARYTTKNNKYTFYLSAKNLLNHKVYTDVSVSDFAGSTYSTSLNERYVLVGLDFSF